MKKNINIICCGLLCFSQIGGASLAEAKDLSETRNPQGLQAEEELAYGVLITYHQWPSLSEQNKIEQQYRTKYQLTMRKRLRLLQILTFGYPKKQALSKVKELCKKLEKDKNIKTCQPNVDIKFKQQKQPKQQEDEPDQQKQQDDEQGPKEQSEDSGPLSDKPLCKYYTYKKIDATTATEAASDDCPKCRAPALNATAAGLLKALAEDLDSGSCSIVQAPCLLFPDYHRGSDHWLGQESSDKTKLSTLWASEFVGMDLVRHEIDQHLKSNKLRSNLVAVFDQFNPRRQPRYHGKDVTQLITSDSHLPTSPFSVRPSTTSSIEYQGGYVKTISLRSVRPYQPLTEEEKRQKEKIAELESEYRVESVQKLVQSDASIKAFNANILTDDMVILKAMMAHRTGPSYINLSRGIMTANCEHFNKLYKQHGTVVVMATGNDAAVKNGNMSENEAQCVNNGEIIGVGSVSPLGLTSVFSEGARGVDIVAPGDQVFLYKKTDEETGEKRFGQRIGTSFAAPMVTGALAAFEQLSGYKLDRAEVKSLLRKTAIPSLSSAFEKPPKNGAGVLNAYKIAKVAQKIKQICDNEDVKNFKNCAEQALKEDKTYEFKSSPVPVGRAFASCASDAESASSQMAPSCDDKKQIFKQLRQQALLSPQNPQLWQQLSCIYEEQGFTENAKLMDATRAAAQKDTTYVESMLAREWPQILKDIEKKASHVKHKDKMSSSEFNEKQNEFRISLTSRLRAFNLLSPDQKKKWTKKLLLEAQAEGYIPEHDDVRAARNHLPRYLL